MAVLWHMHLLGELRARSEERPVERFRTQKTGALLGYLAYFPGRAHPRGVLIDQLWPDDEIAAASHKLSVALSWLRQQLEPPGVPDSSVLVADRASILLRQESVSTDVGEFERCARAAAGAGAWEERVQWLVRASNAYAGRLLPGYYEEWIVPEQRRLEATYLEVLRRLVEGIEAREGAEAAIPHAVRAAAVDPLCESHQHRLIRLYAAAGQTRAALRQYEEFRDLLAEELSAPPSAELTALADRLRAEATGSVPVARLSADRKEVSARSSIAKGGSRVADSPAPAQRLSLPLGGAIPLDSRFYVERAADEEFKAAAAECASIILIKGPRQVGKTSLLARGLHHRRSEGARTAYTDLRVLNSEQLASAEALLRSLSRSLADQLGVCAAEVAVWDDEDGPNVNFRRFVRGLIQQSPAQPLLWGIDEVDRLLGCPFGGEVFALLRSWHNERAFDPQGPWSRLTLAIAYATEVQLFISDLNQSPFNVGQQLSLEDLTFAEVAELNRRCGSPARPDAELARLYRLLGGHPYLMQVALQQLAKARTGITGLEETAEWDSGVFGDHLRRLLHAARQDAGLSEALLAVLAGTGSPDPESFYRLRSAGVLAGETPAEARIRCDLYRQYLGRRLIVR